MKTAVSIPDALFEAADAVARRRKVSRSRLYAEAVERFLAEQDDRAITRRLDEIYARLDSSLSPLLARMQTLSLPAEEW